MPTDQRRATIACDPIRPPGEFDRSGDEKPPRRLRDRTALYVFAALNAAALMALAIDIPVARWLVRDGALKPLHGLLESLEPFGQPTAVLFVAAAVWLCAAGGRYAAPRILALSLGSGLAADVVKVLVARARPNHFDLARSSADTFRGLLPGLGDYGMQSCPSAHTAVAVGFAISLSGLFPAGKPLFLAAAAAVALQRIEAGAHFVSDTLWGASIAWAMHFLLQSVHLPSNTLERLEATDGPATGRPPERAFLQTRDVLDVSADEPAPALNTGIRVDNTKAPGNGPDQRKIAAGDELRSLSIVVPVNDEVESLARLHAELSRLVERLEMPGELIFVDDGSRDGSAHELARLAALDPRVTVLTLGKNCGQALALLAGIREARGDVVALLDADLQNDPRDIPYMLALLRQGYDLAHGWRRDRRDRLFDRRLPSQAANHLISWVTGYRVHDTGCTLKVMRRKTARALPLFGGMHRFIPAVAHAQGARCIEVTARHHPRLFGRSKYGLSRVVRVLADLALLRFVSLALGRHRDALHTIAAVAVVRRGAAFQEARERHRRAA
ncbi:MAG: glycosyltransferase [Planctomycetaceae bacterium]